MRPISTTGAAAAQSLSAQRTPLASASGGTTSFAETLGAARLRYAANAAIPRTRQPAALVPGQSPYLSAPSRTIAQPGASPAGPGALGNAATPANAAGQSAAAPGLQASRTTSSQSGRAPATADPMANAAVRPATPATDTAAVLAAQTTAPGSPVSPTTPVNPVRPTHPMGTAMTLAEFPRPTNDNGRGMHWVPTVRSDKATVDRFVHEAKEMGVKWMVILNNDTKIGENDYLVDQLVANGMMPIIRIYTPNGEKIKGDIEAFVRHYRAKGVHYFQLYNEPNLKGENPDGQVNIDRYLDWWIEGARAVVRGGGLPGFGALAPGGDVNDVEFLKTALEKIKQRGEVDVLDKAWLSMHNYTLNHPLDYQKDANGYLKFRFYDTVIRNALGRSMPIIGTEGGTFVVPQNGHEYPAVTEGQQLQMVRGAYEYMREREPYYFAYSYWVIANEEGGGHDPAFTHHALFKKGGQVSPIVQALKDMTKEEAARAR